MYYSDLKSYRDELVHVLERIDLQEVVKAMKILEEARLAQRFVFTMGNGGSAMTASHIVGDFNKGLSLSKTFGERHRFICLSDNLSTVMSLANDICYEDIFVEQLKNFLHPKDVVIAISGSGNSENVLKAVHYAKENNAVIIAMTGYQGGKLKPLADVCLHVPIENMQIAEDVHMAFSHMMMFVLMNR